MAAKEKKPRHPEQKYLSLVLALLTAAVCANLLFTASLVGFLAAVVILVMIWGIRRGDWPLTRGLSWVLFLYAGINVVVLLLTVSFSFGLNLSAVIWLGIYSGLLILFGCLLRKKSLLAYLKNAPQPEQKQNKITFFKGGWRDL